MSEIEFYDNIRSLKFIAKKNLGQNFLFNKDVCERITDLVDSIKDDNILEIGAGLGSLSYQLVKKDFKSLTLLDIDKLMCQNLEGSFKKIEGVAILNQDILKSDVSNYEYIIGNLPYYITTDIIEYLLLNAKRAKKIIIMVQKEVLPRLKARVGDKEYGPLSILINYLGKIESNFIISRTNFVPAPHVDSIMLTITLNKEKDLAKIRRFYAFLKGLFLHRRKTIYNNLKSLGYKESEISSSLEQLNVAFNRRPEEVDLLEFIKLQELLESI